jgi:uncharacterized membrane protein (UPF0136 family)
LLFGKKDLKYKLMNKRSLYLIYGVVVLILGLTGYFLTHAKSALISALAAGLTMMIMGLLVDKFSVIPLIAKIFNLVFLGAFSWRSTMAIMALNNGHQDKLIPSILLSLMALISVVVFALSVLVKKSVKQN